MVKASAPGKIILFGEHAVVHDKLGIATALGLQSTCEVKKSYNTVIENIGVAKVTEAELGDIFLDVEELIKKKDFDGLIKLLKNDSNVCVKYILANIANQCDFKPVKIKIKSQLRKGMGKSSSVFSAIAFALSQHFELDLSKKQISDLAYRGDMIAHAGTPSGIDNNITTFGGYISYQKSKGFEHLLIDKKIPVVIGDTKIPASTGKMVSMVRELIKKDRTAKNALDNIDAISNEAIDVLQSGDLLRLGKLIDRNQEELRKLNVSTPQLEKLISAAKQSGAYGAKLSGGGGGGIMFAVCSEDNQKKVAEAIRKAGGESIITDLGADGVRLE